MPGAWAILLAALVGRPVGILASIALAMAAGLRLPVRLHRRELIVVSIAASGGFTFALFFAASLIPAGPLLNELKLGALSTVVSAVLAVAAARLLHVGRFSRTPRASSHDERRSHATAAGVTGCSNGPGRSRGSGTRPRHSCRPA